ncbi:hypothetical protein JCM8208_002238 [Rhodotorula glutinis]
MRGVAQLLAIVPALLLANAAPVRERRVTRRSVLELRALGPDGAPLRPSNDSFYQPTGDWASQANGAVLDSRPVWTQFDMGARSVYQVLYKTTSPLGEADATVTTVFRPAEPASPPRVMLLMAPIDTASPDCQVAYSLENGGGSNATSFLQSTVALDIISSLSKGWYVSVPDHEGSNASFISGVTEGLAGIDGLRALLNHNETIPSTDNYSAVIHGYSGGGHASAWTTQFLSTYGEGLNVIAAAYGGVPVDLTSTLDLLNGSNESYLAISSLVGLANAYPELNSYYETILTENGTRAFEVSRTTCNTQLADVLSNVNVSSLFTTGLDFQNNSIAQRYVQGGLLGAPLNDTALTPINITGVVSIPVFQYHSVTDMVVAYEPVPAYVQSQCDRGAKIKFMSSIGTDHSTTSIVYAGDAYQFLDQAFNGTFIEACNTSTVGVDLYPGSPAYIESIGTQAWTLLQALQASSEPANSTSSASSASAAATATSGPMSASSGMPSGVSSMLSSMLSAASTVSGSPPVTSAITATATSAVASIVSAAQSAVSSST